MHSVGYAVTYPTKYKRLRAAFSRSFLRGVHIMLRSDEGLGMLHRLLHRFIRNVELVVLGDCAFACTCCRVSS